MVTPKEILDLIESLPHSDMHIFEDSDGVSVTDEWLVGGFPGKAFVSNSKEESAQQLIDYLDRHVNHDSIVGSIVTRSGYPDLKKVREYCLDCMGTTDWDYYE